MMIYYWATLMMSAAVALAGDMKPSESPESLPTSPSHTENAPISTSTPKITQKINLLDDVTTLADAQQKLLNLPRFQGKTIYVYNKIDFFDGVRPRIELSVQNPNPEQNQELIFLAFDIEKKQWVEGEAEDVRHIKNLSRHFVSIQEIDFQQVKSIADIWRSKANEIQAAWREPYHVAFIWLPARNKRFWHTATLENMRGGQYYLSVNMDGSIWEWNHLRGASSEEQ